MNSIKILGIVTISLLVMYIVVQILNFYGFDSDYYGIYITFYIFLMLTMLVLPQGFPEAVTSFSKTNPASPNPINPPL
jgi:hypothetical protein